MALRLLLDENVPADAATALTALGHDVVQIRETAPGASDPLVLSKATAERRILLTFDFDKDFGDLVVWGRLPAVEGVVLFRLSAARPDETVRMICATMSATLSFAGHLIVVGERRVRIRPLTRTSERGP